MGKAFTPDDISPGTSISRAVLELREALDAAKAKCFVVGLSGGIDSAVTLGLCVRVAPTIALTMFDVWDTPAEARAKEWFKELNRQYPGAIQLEQVRPGTLGSVLDKAVPLRYLRPTEKAKGTEPTPAERRVVGNLTARLRMAILYAWANQRSGLVVGTGNACELYLGYFTKHGDGACDVLPLRHLLKSQVYAVGKELGVPQSIMEAVPSAELWPGQTDEGEMGVSYSDVEKYLRREDVPYSVQCRIEEMHDMNFHKHPTPWW